MDALDEMANIILKPIFDRLCDRAREEVIENYCKQKCGQGPEVRFCPQAQGVYCKLLLLFIKSGSSLN